MCGIAGQVALRTDTSVDRDEVVAMMSAMIHRGPDGEGSWFDPNGRVGLGMRRLAIIDLVTGQQPISNEDGTVVCVFNGEIYNFPALRRALEQRGHVFRTNADTEVIVHAYEDDGPACVERLRGMFALAIWDRRDESLLIARDRLGEKPLYYAEVHGRMSFASEITALYRLAGLKRELDPTALDLYLTHSYVAAPYSIYQAIRKLPAGHLMRVQRGHVSVERYWRLAPRPRWTGSRQELSAAIRSKIDESVRIRMISDVPLGCFLSGGADSSSVVALMSRHSPTPVKTFSIGFKDPRFNELGYARMIAERYGTEHHEYVVEPDAAAVLPQMARHFGEPYGDSSALPTWYLSQLTRRHVTVALNGDGGDELFAGYTWYQTGLALDRLARVTPRWAATLLAVAPKPVGERLRRLGRRLRMTPAERFRSLRCFLDARTKRGVYSKGFHASLGTAAEVYLTTKYDEATGDTLARMQYTDLMTYLPEDLLVKVDRMTMAHSLEGRPPLLDHELVELCASLPAKLKIDGVETKVILREATRDLFPPGFLNRPKMGFSIPVAEWLRTDLRSQCYQLVCGDTLLGQGWFDAKALAAHVDAHMSGARDWSAQLWNLLMLAHWVRSVP